MNNNTNAATNPAIIDINDKERLKHLTFDDLYEDAEAREEQEIREAALDWLEGHVVLCSDNDKSQAYVKLDEASPAYMKLKRQLSLKVKPDKSLYQPSVCSRQQIFCPKVHRLHLLKQELL